MGKKKKPAQPVVVKKADDPLVIDMMAVHRSVRKAMPPARKIHGPSKYSRRQKHKKPLTKQYQERFFLISDVLDC